MLLQNDDVITIERFYFEIRDAAKSFGSDLKLAKIIIAFCFICQGYDLSLITMTIKVLAEVLKTRYDIMTKQYIYS